MSRNDSIEEFSRNSGRNSCQNIVGKVTEITPDNQDLNYENIEKNEIYDTKSELNLKKEQTDIPLSANDDYMISLSQVENIYDSIQDKPENHTPCKNDLEFSFNEEDLKNIVFSTEKKDKKISSKNKSEIIKPNVKQNNKRITTTNKPKIESNNISNFQLEKLPARMITSEIINKNFNNQKNSMSNNNKTFNSKKLESNESKRNQFFNDNTAATLDNINNISIDEFRGTSNSKHKYDYDLSHKKMITNEMLFNENYCLKKKINELINENVILRENSLPFELNTIRMEMGFLKEKIHYLEFENYKRNLILPILNQEFLNETKYRNSRFVDMNQNKFLRDEKEFHESSNIFFNLNEKFADSKPYIPLNNNKEKNSNFESKISYKACNSNNETKQEAQNQKIPIQKNKSVEKNHDIKVNVKDNHKENNIKKNIQIGVKNNDKNNLFRQEIKSNTVTTNKSKEIYKKQDPIKIKNEIKKSQNDQKSKKPTNQNFIDKNNDKDDEFDNLMKKLKNNEKVEIFQLGNARDLLNNNDKDINTSQPNEIDSIQPVFNIQTDIGFFKGIGENSTKINVISEIKDEKLKKFLSTFENESEESENLNEENFNSKKSLKTTNEKINLKSKKTSEFAHSDLSNIEEKVEMEEQIQLNNPEIVNYENATEYKFICSCTELHHSQECVICDGLKFINISNIQNQLSIFSKRNEIPFQKSTQNKDWFDYMYKLSVWKYYSLEKYEVGYLNLTNISKDLLKKYDIVFNQGKRSFLTKVSESDAIANRNMVLLVISIKVIESTFYEISKYYEIELTDGYKSAYSKIYPSNPISHLIRKNLIYPGIKLSIAITKTVDFVQDQPLYLHLEYNSISRAAIDEKLGISKKIYCLRNLFSLRDDGGEISSIDIIILKKYDYFYFDSNTKKSYSAGKFEKPEEDCESKKIDNLNKKNNKVMVKFKALVIDSLLLFNYLNKLKTPIYEIKKNFQSKNFEKKFYIEFTGSIDLYEEIVQGNRYKMTRLTTNYNQPPKKETESLFQSCIESQSKYNKPLIIKAPFHFKFNQIPMDFKKKEAAHYNFFKEHEVLFSPFENHKLEIFDIILQKTYSIEKMINEEFYVIGIYLDYLILKDEKYILISNSNKNFYILKFHSNDFFDESILTKNKILYIKNIQLKAVFNPTESSFFHIENQGIIHEFSKIILSLETTCYTIIKTNECSKFKEITKTLNSYISNNSTCDDKMKESILKEMRSN